MMCEACIHDCENCPFDEEEEDRVYCEDYWDMGDLACALCGGNCWD